MHRERGAGMPSLAALQIEAGQLKSHAGWLLCRPCPARPCRKSDFLLSTHPGDLHGDLLDLGTSVSVFDLEDQDIVTEKIRR